MTTSLLLVLSFLSCLVDYNCASSTSVPSSFQEHIRRDSDSSNDRSAYSIVWACFATIFACTWVSVHSNIPGPHDGKLQILGRRLAVMLNMLIIPEVVLLWTARQYIASREIWRKHRERGWTKTHAYFALMGGFALYEDNTFIRTLEVTDLEELTSQGVINWPTITQEEIEDKSKGDYLSKGIVVLQTIWFVTQMIARGIQHLDITEIEVVTLAFSALTMIIYFLWWNKPLDVSVPVAVHVNEGHTILNGQDMKMEVKTDEQPSEENVLSAHTLAVLPADDIELGLLSDTVETRLLQDTDNDHPNESSSKQVEDPPSSTPDHSHNSGVSEQPEAESFWQDIFAPIAAEFRGFYQDNSLPLAIFMSVCYSVGLFLGTIFILVGAALSPILLPLYIASPTLLTRLWDATKLFIIYVVWKPVKFFAVYIIWTPIKEFYDAVIDMVSCTKVRTGCPERVPTFYAPKCEDEEISFPLGVIIGTIFGAIHCIAWSFSFPTYAEMWIWRISSVIIAASPLALSIVMMGISPLFNEEDSPDFTFTWREMIASLAGIWAIIVIIGYIGARLCLIVLPLMALRALPDGAYVDVNWTIFVPHVHV